MDIQSLTQRRVKLQKQLDDFIKAAEAQINRMQGALALLDDLLAEVSADPLDPVEPAGPTET